ncbi:Holliday junction branch migration protein RuvA [Flavobacteriaceae bacterium Ap0902]|nr:Holliday junction branch migration protein RuvA [Flavobacteriaceae bacterium Ap0902]
MIAQLKGRLVEIYASHAIIDCNGVGYHVHISLNTYAALEKKDEVLIYTHHLVREDAQLLYGFGTKSERSVFEKLISVNGVGPSSGMMMLSTLEPAEIFSAISEGDDKTLQSVKGIGAKTAQRIIIDLKDKIEKLDDVSFSSSKSENKIKLEALSALEVLGISNKQSEKYVQQLIKDNPRITLEEVIKSTLKKI